MVFVYLDDIFVIAPTEQERGPHLSQVRELLTFAGFWINEKKCTLPSQEVEFLGILVDFVRGVVSIPPHKHRSYKKDLAKLLSHDTISLGGASTISWKSPLLACLFPPTPSFDGFSCGFR